MANNRPSTEPAEKLPTSARPRATAETRAEAAAAVERMRAAAETSGASKITEDEIDEEIRAVRTERRARRTATT